jgi:hypothetical protein
MVTVSCCLRQDIATTQRSLWRCAAACCVVGYKQGTFACHSVQWSIQHQATPCQPCWSGPHRSRTLSATDIEQRATCNLFCPGKKRQQNPSVWGRCWHAFKITLSTTGKPCYVQHLTAQNIEEESIQRRSRLQACWEVHLSASLDIMMSKQHLVAASVHRQKTDHISQSFDRCAYRCVVAELHTRTHDSQH